MTQRVEAILALGQQLVRVTLVADIPDQAVIGEVVQVVQGNREFDHPHAGTEVTTGHRDGIHDDLAQLGAQVGQLLTWQFLEVDWVVDQIE